MCDFGLSEYIDGDGALERVGTACYAAPEMLTAECSCGTPLDLWGLGLVLFMLLSGEHPFEGLDMHGSILAARFDLKAPAWQVGVGAPPGTARGQRGCVALLSSSRVSSRFSYVSRWAVPSQRVGALPKGLITSLLCVLPEDRLTATQVPSPRNPRERTLLGLLSTT